MWREASGILSDKRIPIMLKGKLYNSSDASNGVWNRKT